MYTLLLSTSAHGPNKKNIKILIRRNIKSVWKVKRDRILPITSVKPVRGTAQSEVRLGCLLLHFASRSCIWKGNTWIQQFWLWTLLYSKRISIEAQTRELKFKRILFVMIPHLPPLTTCTLIPAENHPNSWYLCTLTRNYEKSNPGVTAHRKQNHCRLCKKIDFKTLLLV